MVEKKNSRAGRKSRLFSNNTLRWRSVDLDLSVQVDLALIHNFHHGTYILLDVAKKKIGMSY